MDPYVKLYPNNSKILDPYSFDWVEAAEKVVRTRLLAVILLDLANGMYPELINLAVSLSPSKDLVEVDDDFDEVADLLGDDIKDPEAKKQQKKEERERKEEEITRELIKPKDIQQKATN